MDENEKLQFEMKKAEILILDRRIEILKETNKTFLEMLKIILDKSSITS